MVGKRLVVIGFLALSGLVAAPLPADAQLIDFMKWISGLDPGPFKGVGYDQSLACFERDTNRQTPAVVQRNQATLRWKFKPGCTDERTTRATEAFRDPKVQDSAVLLRSDVKAFVTVSDFYGTGDHNLTYPAGSSVKDKMTVNILTGSINYRPTRILDMGLGVGWAHFSGGAKSVDKMTVSTGVTVSPLLLAPLPRGAAFLKHVPIRLSIQMFPQGFTPQDFGALTPAVTHMTGKFEEVATVSFLFQFGRPR